MDPYDLPLPPLRYTIPSTPTGRGILRRVLVSLPFFSSGPDVSTRDLRNGARLDLGRTGIASFTNPNDPGVGKGGS